MVVQHFTAVRNATEFYKNNGRRKIAVDTFHVSFIQKRTCNEYKINCMNFISLKMTCTDNKFIAESDVSLIQNLEGSDMFTYVCVQIFCF